MAAVYKGNSKTQSLEIGPVEVSYGEYRLKHLRQDKHVGLHIGTIHVRVELDDVDKLIADLTKMRDTYKQ